MLDVLDWLDACRALDDDNGAFSDLDVDVGAVVALNDVAGALNDGGETDDNCGGFDDKEALDNTVGDDEQFPGWVPCRGWLLYTGGGCLPS